VSADTRNNAPVVALDNWRCYRARVPIRERPAGFVNWSILLSPDGADAWDALHLSLREDIDRRTLKKTDVFRALVEAAKNPLVRAEVIRALQAQADDQAR
jgi:hypothetical protein